MGRDATPTQAAYRRCRHGGCRAPGSRLGWSCCSWRSPQRCSATSTSRTTRHKATTQAEGWSSSPVSDRPSRQPASNCKPTWPRSHQPGPAASAAGASAPRTPPSRTWSAPSAPPKVRTTHYVTGCGAGRRWSVPASARPPPSHAAFMSRRPSDGRSPKTSPSSPTATRCLPVGCRMRCSPSADQAATPPRRLAHERGGLSGAAPSARADAERRKAARPSSASAVPLACHSQRS
jgi:hypothetical protein